MLADQLAEAVQHIEGQYVEVEVETPDVADAEVERKTLPADPDVKNFSYAWWTVRCTTRKFDYDAGGVVR